MITVSALWRHPIKGHGREALDHMTLTPGQTDTIALRNFGSFGDPSGASVRSDQSRVWGDGYWGCSARLSVVFWGSTHCG